MELMDAIKGRRSVRAYRRDVVPDEMVQRVLEALQWAPSWANTQCWEVIVVRDDETRRKLADTLSPKNPAREGIVQAPLTLVLIGIEGKAGFKGGVTCTDKGDWYMFDVALAMQNLCLAAHGMGLGTVIVGLFDAQEVARTLHVPQGRAVVAMTPLGVPDKVPSPPKRKEISELVYHETYGRR